MDNVIVADLGCFRFRGHPDFPGVIRRPSAAATCAWNSELPKAELPFVATQHLADAARLAQCSSSAARKLL